MLLKIQSARARLRCALVVKDFRAQKLKSSCFCVCFCVCVLLFALMRFVAVVFADAIVYACAQTIDGKKRKRKKERKGVCVWGGRAEEGV
eukprot:SAG11_NODE_186_length_13142_cov_17.515679_7_plen_90_part_00